jgi:hypothetical protein
MRSHHRIGRALVALLTSAALAGLAVASPQTGEKKPAPQKKDRAVGSPAAVVTAEQWGKADTSPLKPGELDQMIAAELKKHGVKPAPLTTDEQFIRRVYLDLTGKLPMPADIDEFVKDKRADKRGKLIDRLLETDDFARYWANYWHSVIASRVTDPLLLATGEQFKGWMREQLKANKNWADIARALLTAEGEMRFFPAKGAADGKDTKEYKPNGPAFLLGSRRGTDAVTERAAETSRIFLGVQIQCAQCHDHPSDVWKRQQFHEFAAYFGRLRERPIFEEKRIVGFALVSQPFGEYQMPGKDNLPPKKGFKGAPGTGLQPRFLDGKAAAKGLSDQARRKALVEAIVSKDNPWFAGAYANRMWGELLGQSFYQPIDDLGPQKEAVFGPVLARLAGAFKGSDYDVKGFFRMVMTTETYQRQIRAGEAIDEHLLFAGQYPKRLRGDAIWQSLVCTLGPIGVGPGKGFGGKAPGPFAGRFGLEGTFKQEFGYDPSTKVEEIEGSVSQALMLMNNPQLNQKMRAVATNLLGRVLSAYPKDDEAVTVVYLRALARTPTDRELERCRSYIARVGNRAEAFEDILWVLINSTEFQTKR